MKRAGHRGKVWFGASVSNGDFDSGDRVPVPEDYLKKAVLFVVNAHAATVNMKLYPPTSSMVTETLEKAMGWLDELFQQMDTFTVSTIESSLLINDIRLEDIEQQKPPIKSFVSWMGERGLTSIEFNAGVTGDELRSVFELLGELLADMELREGLTGVLEERGITNIFVNQRVYVAVDAGDDPLRKASPLDALKDELLIRYLMGKVDLSGVEDRELVEVLSDRGKVGGLMSQFLAEEGAGEGVVVRSKKADEALGRLSEMVDAVKDEGLRQSLQEQVSGIVSEMSPGEMTSILSSHGPEDFDIRHVRQNVITMLKDEQLMDMVDSMIDEYIDMKKEAGELDTAWLRDRLKSLNDLMLEVRGSARGDTLAETINEKLDVASITEERDASTGARVLSAYELLGGPLEEEALPDLGEGIDGTVPRQIGQLYGMSEDDLAAGLLLKLTDNLSQQSPGVRRFAAALIKDTLAALETGGALLAADVLRPGLIEAVTAENDYRAFTDECESLAIAAELLIRAGRVDEASDVIELIGRQASPESGKGIELVKHASSVIERLKSPEGVVDVVGLLSEEDEEKRLDAVRALAGLGPDALAPLVDMVKDRGEVELRDRALEALQAAGQVGVEALAAELKKENPWYVHRNVLNLLAGLGRVEALDAVNEMAGHPDERIRREAVWSLARIGAPESLPIVLNATRDNSPAVRRTAVRVLGMFGDSSVTGYLIEIINSAGPRGREEEQGFAEAAVLALGDLRDPSLVPQLLELIGKGGLFKKGRPDEVRAAACIALGTIGDSAAMPVLVKAAKDPGMMVSSNAEKAIRRIQLQDNGVRS